jgi:hypothetical protein
MTTEQAAEIIKLLHRLDLTGAIMLAEICCILGCIFGSMIAFRK